jgi:hypothetical protein
MKGGRSWESSSREEGETKEGRNLVLVALLAIL